MSGTSSSRRSSTSGRGSFSSSIPVRVSISSVSPGRRWMPRMASASSQTRSSSARPTISARTPSSMTSLTETTSPLRSGARARMMLKLSLSATSAPRSSSSTSMSGCMLTRILRPLGQDVDRAVVVLADDHAVGRRRAGELVDLVPQRGDVLARLPQGVAQLLVLGDGLGQLALGLEQPLLQGPDPLGPVGHLAPKARPPPRRGGGPPRAGGRARPHRSSLTNRRACLSGPSLGLRPPSVSDTLAPPSDGRYSSAWSPSWHGGYVMVCAWSLFSAGCAV